MIINLNFIILIGFAGFGKCVLAKACEIDLDNEEMDHNCGGKSCNAKAKYPMLVDRNGDIIYPVGGRTLTFANDDSVASDKLPQLGLYCHYFGKKGKRSLVSSSSIAPLKKDAQYVPLRCNDDGTFTLFNDPNSAAIDVYKAKCSKKQYPSLKKHENEAILCSDTGADGRTDDLANKIHYVEIGWNMTAMNSGPTELKDMIQLCIDEKVYGTIWTRHIVRGASIEFQDKGGSRPSFRADNPGKKRFFHGKSSGRENKMYKKTSQIKMATFNGLQGIVNGSSSSTNYFAKGHLSPDAAFIYQLEQYATYYFINVAPQFQAFNAGNWKALEWGTRQAAARLQRDILVYTGTLDMLIYKNKELFLWYKNTKDNQGITRGIPVPKYYWKILYDEKKHQGIAFVGLNDPYSKDLDDPIVQEYICPNVCDEASWVKEYVPKMNVEVRGHITCCTIQGLADVVGNVESFKSDQGKYIKDAELLKSL